MRSYGVRNIGVAGSVARDAAEVGSDLDVVADMDLSESPAGRYFGLIAFLEDLVHCEIDLLTRDRIKEHVRPFIEAEEVRVF
ncbi:MAG: nucleotidyltransferase domain-containing protein [Dehalococcoidia bacterium]|nr:nucleotidyltransferase domain-containing protein [Dehalococcoidia bacterium]